MSCAPARRSFEVGAAVPPGPVALRFDHVGFSWPDGSRVLDDLSFSVAPGEVVALVGATGSGKTTLCELAVRLMDPTSGSVQVGGVDVTELDPASLRQAVALVFQESFLFADPLRTNVDLTGELSGEELAEVAGIAHAVHGAIGISEEYDLQLLTRRLHEWRMADGSEGYLSQVLGGGRLGSAGPSVDWISKTVFA